MKKFLSLALALIMTLSLVTISAGATEYKDLTDKDEIQYEEAVAVLNRLGIITGYAEGDFRPQGELTRGAAAKIIVSLLIGAEAAEALPKDSSPYPDVPAGSTFAGVISYCKNMKIIDGYGDGTFRSTGTLTGYAFSKMLLGILGYDGKQEGGFTGAGWTTNVARVGHQASLFDRITFNGGETVNRETACQLALNTLKATEVEYTGGMDVVVGDTQINAPKTRTFKTSNQEWASHISSRRAGYNMGGNSQTSNNIDNHYTVEFGEEHFQDLRMDHDRNTHDQFGRPANVWSYKKVTIGTFAIEPDFVYTTQVAHNVATVTAASKVRALELSGFELDADTNSSASINGQTYTNLWLNGKWYSANDRNADGTLITDEKDITDENDDHYLTRVADIADYTDNGTLVEVYVDDADADFIRDVVVIKTQLMEVKAQKTESVALKLYDDGSDAEGDIIYGYNQAPIDVDVNDVELNDDLYASLKDKKVGDILAVVPVYAEGVKYDVAEAYTPETVAGALTRVETYGNVGNGPNVISATVGGTAYKVALWNKDLYDIDGAAIRVTRKDVTLYMDVYGNAMLATDVGATSNFMIVGGYHSGLVNGRVVTYADGWDINGNEISLNLGNHSYVGDLEDNKTNRIGELMHYSSATDSNYAEWKLDYLGVYDVASKRGDEANGTEKYSLKASNSKVLLNGWNLNKTGKTSDGKDYSYSDDADYKYNDGYTSLADHGYVYNTALTQNIATDDSGIKFIYVTIGDDKEVDSIEIKNGMQAASNDEILGADAQVKFVNQRAQACVSLKNNDTQVTGDSVIKAIVIKQDSSSANLSNLVYIHNWEGTIGRNTDNQGRIVYGYQVKFIGTSDWNDTQTIYSYKNLNIGTFARARKALEAPTEVEGVTADNFYALNAYSQRTGEALSVSQTGSIEKILDNNKTLLKLTNYFGDDTRNDGVTAMINGQHTEDKYLDLGDETANDIVSINGARIIDLTDYNIDSASDLKDAWTDGISKADQEAGWRNRISITMLYNDKMSDDEFRDVYVLVIRDVAYRAYQITDTPSNPTNPDTKVPGTIVPSDTSTGLENVKFVLGGVSYDTLAEAVAKAKVGDVITIEPAAGYKVTAPANGKITVTEEDAAITITVEEDNGENPPSGEGTDVTDKAIFCASVPADDAIRTGIKLVAADGKLNVTGLGDGEYYRVVVNGNLETAIVADGSMDYAEGDRIEVQKFIGYDMISLGGFTQLVPKFDDTELAANTRSMSLLHEAPEDAAPVVTFDGSLGFKSLKLNPTAADEFVVELVSLTVDGKKVVAFRLNVKDTDDFATAVAGIGTNLNVQLGSVPAGTNGFVNLPDSETSVEIPLETDGTPAVILTTDEAGNVTEIAAKEGETLKVGDQIVDKIDTSTVKADEVTIATPAEATGLPIEIGQPSATITHWGQSNTVKNLQSDIDLTDITKDANGDWTLKVTGTLHYATVKGWNGSGDTTGTPGYFLAFKVDQTNADQVAYTEAIGVVDKAARGITWVKGVTGITDFKNGTGNDSAASSTANLSQDVIMKVQADNQNTKRTFKIVDTAGRIQVLYIDVSGLTLETREPISFSKADPTKVSHANASAGTNATDARKISDLQTIDTFEVTGEGSTKTVKVTGTLKPMIGWTKFGSESTVIGDGTADDSYVLAVYVDISKKATGDSITAVNPAGKNKTVNVIQDAASVFDNADAGSSNTKGIVLIRVAGLKDTAPTTGLQFIAVTADGVSTTYNFDLSGLKLEKPDVEIVIGKGPNYGKQTSDFGTGMAVTRSGSNGNYTYKLTGELNPISNFTAFSENTDIQSGFYVPLQIKAASAGLTELKCTDNYNPSTFNIPLTDTDEGVFRVGSLNGELSNPPTITAKDEFGRTINITLDYSGLTLKTAREFEFTTPAINAVKEIETSTGMSYRVTDLQQDIQFTFDENDPTKIVVTGNLNYVSDWMKFSSTKPELQSGYYLTFGLVKGANAAGDGKATVKTVYSNKDNQTTLNPTTASIFCGWICGADGAKNNFTITLDGTEYTVDTSNLTLGDKNSPIEPVDFGS